MTTKHYLLLAFLGLCTTNCDNPDELKLGDDGSGTSAQNSLSGDQSSSSAIQSGCNATGSDNASATGETCTGSTNTVASDTGTATHDPRCDLMFYDSEDDKLCGDPGGTVWWGLNGSLNDPDAPPTCWPSHTGSVCNDPKYGNPFASIEECLRACPNAQNLTEDDFTLKKCDGGRRFSVPESYEKASLNTVTGKLSVDYTAIIGCPLYGPHFRICHDETRDGKTADGKPQVHLRLEYDSTNDWCDGSLGVQQEYDLASLLMEVRERPFSIVLDASTDFTLAVD